MYQSHIPSRCLVSLVVAMLGWSLAGARTETPVPRGFTTDTVITLVLDDVLYDRFAEQAGNSFDTEWGTISLASGHCTSASNKIMLYGDRMEPRFSGESDWQMAPRPANVYMQYDATSLRHEFPIGPACEPPEGMDEWSQWYRYTAVGIRVNGTSASGSDILEVYDMCPDALVITIDDDDTY